MSLKTKINQRLTDSSTWILSKPDSLVILMIMGSGIAFLFFGVFAAATGYSKNWFLMILFSVFSLLSLKQFITVMKMVKKMGLKNALGGITANEFVWHKNKEGNKLYGGIKNERNGTEQDIKEGNECNADGDKEGGGKVRGSKKNTESTNPWDNLSVRIDENNRKETRNK